MSSIREEVANVEGDDAKEHGNKQEVKNGIMQDKNKQISREKEITGKPVTPSKI